MLDINVNVNVNVNVEFGSTATRLIEAVVAAVVQGMQPPEIRNSLAEMPGDTAQAETASADVPDFYSPTAPEVKTPPAVFLKELPEKKWSAERDVCLASMKALGSTWHEICIEVNKLPGPEIASGNACSMRFFKLRNDGRLPVVATPEKPEVVEPVVVEPVAAVLSPQRPEPVAAPAPPRVVADLVAKHVPKPPTGAKVRVSVAEAWAWAAQRGLCNGFESDLDMAVVNAKREQLGMPRFELQHRRA